MLDTNATGGVLSSITAVLLKHLTLEYFLEYSVVLLTAGIYMGIKVAHFSFLDNVRAAQRCACQAAAVFWYGLGQQWREARSEQKVQHARRMAEIASLRQPEDRRANDDQLFDRRDPARRSQLTGD